MKFANMGSYSFFVCAALYATERMFGERSARWALAQGLFLLGALLTHYIALVVIGAIGAYTVIRFLSMGAPRRVVFTFAGCQLVLCAVLTFLYFSQIRTMIAPTGSTDYLQPYYYLKGQESAAGFVWRMVLRTFGHAIGMNRLALVPLLLFAAGLAAIAMGRSKSTKISAVLIISPFVVGFAAGFVARVSICRISPPGVSITFSCGRHCGFSGLGSPPYCRIDVACGT